MICKFCATEYSMKKLFICSTHSLRDALLMGRARADAIREGGLQEVVSGQDAKAARSNNTLKRTTQEY
jgi:hypothetical protein